MMQELKTSDDVTNVTAAILDDGTEVALTLPEIHKVLNSIHAALSSLTTDAGAGNATRQADENGWKDYMTYLRAEANGLIERAIETPSLSLHDVNAKFRIHSIARAESDIDLDPLLNSAIDDLMRLTGCPD